jgi:hypothetical protein
MLIQIRRRSITAQYDTILSVTAESASAVHNGGNTNAIQGGLQVAKMSTGTCDSNSCTNRSSLTHFNALTGVPSCSTRTNSSFVLVSQTLIITVSIIDYVSLRYAAHLHHNLRP